MYICIYNYLSIYFYFFWILKTRSLIEITTVFSFPLLADYSQLHTLFLLVIYYEMPWEQSSFCMTSFWLKLTVLEDLINILSPHSVITGTQHISNTQNPERLARVFPILGAVVSVSKYIFFPLDPWFWRSKCFVQVFPPLRWELGLSIPTMGCCDTIPEDTKMTSGIGYG